ncbi:hypothetical protein EV126DRAFT_409956 [Verticillium dahliae]|nr:hypothetical protein EV126DRAFT_435756 [Verticillium dahliae]KAH6706733.1 hypothetical protein EV126DRAFT_409956 [Verticillium dahliae]
MPTVDCREEQVDLTAKSAEIHSTATHQNEPTHHRRAALPFPHRAAVLPRVRGNRSKRSRSLALLLDWWKRILKNSMPVLCRHPSLLSALPTSRYPTTTPPISSASYRNVCLFTASSFSTSRLCRPKLPQTKSEIGKYDKIAASGLSSSELPTSRLYAMVVGSKGRLRGLIYHFIKSEERLTWAVDERAPLALREKCAAQIKDTVAKLHHLGVVWGDVKADNVLVDENGNAIVIDLKGGTTQGWVDREKEGTVEGDAQGVENMMDFIFNDESMLRPPPLGPDDEPIVKLRGY